MINVHLNWKDIKKASILNYTEIFCAHMETQYVLISVKPNITVQELSLLLYN